MKFTTNIAARVRDAYAYRHRPEHLHALATVYWRAVLPVLALIVVCSVLYGASLLMGVLASSGVENTLVSQGSAVPALNRTQLQAVLDGFAARRANYEFLKANPPRVADPSK